MNSGFRRASRVATITVCALALMCLRSTAQTAADPAADQPSAPPPITAEFKAAAEALGATVTDDGWIHYKNVPADTADLLDKTTVLVTGTKSADGTCTISESRTVPVGSLGYYSSTKASNPQTCQEMVEGGFLNTTSASQLHLSTSSTGTVRNGISTSNSAGGDESGTEPSATADSNLPTEADSGTADANTAEAAGSTNSSNSTLGTAPEAESGVTSTAVSGVTRTSKAYGGSRWVDPLFIVITALTIDLTWNHNGRSVPSASYVIKPYKFKYDGWTTSGTPHPPFTFKRGSVNVTASETFKNVDFEQLLLYLASLLPFPASLSAETTVYAACGFDASPAVFKHTESITGKADGSYSWSYSDSKKGGCSDLVHHDTYTAYGTF